MAYTFDVDEIQDLRDNIEVLEAASKTPARSRATKVGPVVDQICEHAYQFGLPEPELLRLIELVTIKTELDQSTITTLIKNFYPTSKVSSDVVTRIVNCLGQAKRKPPAAAQAALVKWLTAVHDVLEDGSSLLRFYTVLFNLLDMVSLRPVLCQLLCLITRRKHVRPFRIQRLLELAQQTAGEPALLNLLRVYKNFCPELIIGATAAKIPQSLLPDAEWRQRLKIIQQNHASLTGDVSGAGGFRIARGENNGRRSMIPDVHTFHASEAAKTLEEIHSATELVESLENLEAPSQIASALRDPLLQKFLQLGGSQDAEQRLEFWLTRYLEEELENVNEGFGLSATLGELLVGIVGHAESSKELPQVVEQFLRLYLPLWNGSSDLGAILDLMALIPPQPFRALHNDLLSTLERSVLSGAEAPFDALFGFYGTFAQRWMNTSPASTGRTPRGFLKSNALFDLIDHVSILAESALAAGQPTHAAILTFYERMADLITEQISAKKQILPPVLPPRSLAYSLATTASLSEFSRLCALLVTYKRCFEKQEAGVTRIYQANATDLLNGYLMDLCNMIWRSRALNNTDTNAMGLLCPGQVTSGLQSYLSKVERDYSIHTTFDFSHGALTAALSQSAFVALEEGAHNAGGDEMPLHAGPVTQRSLTVLDKEGGMSLSWKQYRIEMLNWLEVHGFDGMKKLMFATMKDLMK